MSGSRLAIAPRGARLAVVAGLFFLSGFSALVYQIAWQRLLGLFGGADTIASTLVVSAFLAGLGLGSLVGGLFADRLTRRRALVLFGVCELSIALYGALSVPLFYDVLFLGLVELSRSRLLVLAVAFVSLLVPTALMGMSLPFLSRAMVDDIGDAPARVGVLYAINTLGAGVGALVTGFWLIGSFGYWPAILVGATFNAIVGVGALLVDRGGRPTARVDASPPGIAAAVPSAPDTDGALGRWCVYVFASGFLAVVVQIVWYRIHGTLMQGNAYGFALVLGVFLVGDAIGLLIGARLAHRVADPGRLLLLLQGATALIAGGGVYALYLADGVSALAEYLINVDHVAVPGAHALAVIAVVTVAVFSASVVMGFTFPLSQRAVQTDLARVGRRVGMIQLANIAGNSLGGLVAGLVLLRFVGSAGTVVVAVLIGLAFVLYQVVVGARKKRAVGLAVALGLLAAIFPGNDSLWARLHGVGDGQQADVAEDHTGLALLRRFENGYYLMYIQGHSQSCLPVCTVHAFLGAIGPLVHPAPERVLVVGVAAGGTPYSAGVNPATRSVRAVEIVAPTLDLIDRFVARGGKFGIDRLKRDPRFELVVGDGRHDLFVEGLTYDVIEADAMLPHTSHSGLLYSREYFGRVRTALKPGGIAVQWAPTPRTIATFRAVFPHVVYAEPALLGSDRPIAYDAARIAARLDEPAIRDYLSDAEVNIDELRARVLSAHVIVWGPADMVAATDINTDLWPRDEYYLNNPTR